MRAVLPVLVALVGPLGIGAATAGALHVNGADPMLVSAAFYVGALLTCAALLLSARGRHPVRARRWNGRGAWRGAGYGLLRLVPWLLLAHGSPASGGWAAVLPAAGLVVLAAVSEECQFRGLLLPRLTEICRWPAAVALTTALFVALHAFSVPPALLVVVAADAVAFAALVRHCGGLSAAVTMHSVINVGSVLWVPASSVAPGVVAAYVVCAVAVDVAVVAHVRRAAPRPPQGPPTTRGERVAERAPVVEVLPR